MDYENRIIDYLEGNILALALVIRQQQAKLQVQEAGGRNAKVTEKQVMVVHGRGDTSSFSAQAQTLVKAIADEQSQIELELLWEGVSQSSDEYSLAQLSVEYFGSTCAVAESAIGRMLLADKTYFKRKGQGFVARSADEVETIQRQQRREAERAAQREAAHAWARQLLSSKPNPDSVAFSVPAELSDFLRNVEAMMFQGHSNEATTILAEVDKRRTPRELGLEMLQRLDRLPPDSDPFLLLNGISAGFSDNLEAWAAAIAAYQAQSQRQDFSAPISFSIDDSDTREIDDAFSVRQLADGKLEICIHIADPNVFIAKDDPIDQAARDRPLSLYLPTTTVTMLPERIGCDLASLNARQMRPCLSFCLQVDPATNTVEQRQLQQGQLQLQHRLDYEQTDALLLDGAADDDALKIALRHCYRLADNLHTQRLEAGAVELVRPELKVRVHANEISIKLQPAQSASRRLVSELMIYANGMAAEYALNQDVPVIYRQQPPPANAIKAMLEYDPVIFERTVRQMQRTRLSTFPQRHCALGLDVYTQVSSPIRRYTDLVIQRQLAAHLQGREYPYGAEELIEVLGAVDRVESDNRRIERDATLYWTLEYLQRHCQGQRLTATVLSNSRAGIIAELDQFLVRGSIADGNDLKPGEQVEIMLAEVRPKQALLVFKRC